MEEIQFLNYILSLIAVLLAVYAVWISHNTEKNSQWQIKDLYDQIRFLKNSSNDKGRK
jgi:high-affinity Fe2+/Pb2+ permease